MEEGEEEAAGEGQKRAGTSALYTQGVLKKVYCPQECNDRLLSVG
jgi:hypothetical protein